MHLAASCRRDTSVADDQRTNYMKQLSRLSQQEPDLFATVYDRVERNFRKDNIPKSGRSLNYSDI
ncbi:MAG: hypothetical protein ACLFM0_10695 [Spirochaetales bacterium]